MVKTNSQFYSKHSFYQLLAITLISFAVISCVTINIYFPAAAAEKVAEQIVNDVLNSEAPADVQKDSSDSKMDNSQYLLDKSFFSSSPLLAVLDFVIPAAQAGQANISIDSPKIRSIRKSMEKRQSKLRSYYSSGTVGFTNKGMIASVSNAGLSVKQKSIVKKLIKAENRDRQALYAEIANANGHPEWLADIQKTFAKTWINKISSGWMYQSKSGQWSKK